MAEFWELTRLREFPPHPPSPSPAPGRGEPSLLRVRLQNSAQRVSLRFGVLSDLLRSSTPRFVQPFEGWMSAGLPTVGCASRSCAPAHGYSHLSPSGQSRFQPPILYVQRRDMLA